MLAVEAAERQIRVKIRCIHTHLEDSPIEFDGDLGRAIIEEVCAQTGDRFDVRRVHFEHLFVGGHTVLHIADVLVDAAQRNEQCCVRRKLLQSIGQMI